jgi:hypothetical protein
MRLNLPSKNKRIYAGLLLMTGVFVFCVVGLHVSKAYALSNIGPDPNDFSCCSEGYTVAPASNPYSPVPVTDIKLYFTAPGLQKISITDGDTCVPYSGANYNNPGNYRNTGNDYGDMAFLDPASDPWKVGDLDTQFSVISGSYQSAPLYGVFSSAANCKTAVKTLTVDVSQFTYDASIGYYVGELIIQAMPPGTPGGDSGSQNSFIVTLPNSADVLGNDSSIPADAFGIYRRFPGRQQPQTDYNNWHQWFGTPCYIGPVTANGWTFDDDNVNGAQPIAMWNELRAYKPNGNGTYTYVGTVPVTWYYKGVKITGTGFPYLKPGPDPNSYYVYSGSKRFMDMRFTALQNYRYDWYWNGVFEDNLMNYRLPFDSIYAVATCKNIAPTCGDATENPGVIDPHTLFNITASVDFSNAANATAALSSGDKITVQVRGPTPLNTFNYGPATIAPLIVNGTTLAGTTGNIGPTLSSGQFNVAYSLVDSSGNTIINCNKTFSVANMPYFNVTGGDVIAGNGMDVGAACTPQDQYGGVVSWNQEGPTYRGAGTQYAAFALNYLQDFASANTTIPSGSPPIGKPIGLSFSNQAAYVDESGVGSDTYGGGLGAESCVPDYYGTHPATPTDGSGNPTYGQAQFPGANATKVMYISNGTAGGSNLTLSGTINIQNGSHTTIYVDGNVQINGDINFSNNYAGINDIPSFTLIARGNIYVSSGVGHLDGWYIAEPTDSAGDGGILYTCTKAGTDFTAPALDNNLYRSCNITKLTFDGSVVAKQVWLTRTSGTLYNNSPAEVINFMPTLWLTNPPGIGGSPPTTSNYDSITDLPPNL